MSGDLVLEQDVSSRDGESKTCSCLEGDYSPQAETYCNWKGVGERGLESTKEV